MRLGRKVDGLVGSTMFQAAGADLGGDAEKPSGEPPRALANDPQFVLADEPTGALDSKNGAAVFSIFRGLADEGRTAIVVTHDETLASTAGRAIHIVDGRVAR